MNLQYSGREIAARVGWWFLVAFVLSLGSVMGCGDAFEGDVYHHEETPEHKPLHFAAAVDALNQKLHREALTSEDFSIVVDLFDWLPEFAAESDLDQAEWFKINDLAKQGQGILKTFQVPANQTTKDSATAAPSISEADRQSLHKILDELRTWCHLKTLHEPIYDGRHDHHDH